MGWEECKVEYHNNMKLGSILSSVYIKVKELGHIYETIIIILILHL